MNTVIPIEDVVPVPIEIASGTDRGLLVTSNGHLLGGGYLRMAADATHFALVECWKVGGFEPAHWAMLPDEDGTPGVVGKTVWIVPDALLIAVRLMATQLGQQARRLVELERARGDGVTQAMGVLVRETLAAQTGPGSHGDDSKPGHRPPDADPGEG